MCLFFRGDADDNVAFSSPNGMVLKIDQGSGCLNATFDIRKESIMVCLDKCYFTSCVLC